MKRDSILKKFRELFKGEPLLIRSPGRVNLIGEHTDYNDGFVLPAAINKEVVFATQRNNSNLCRIYAADLDESFSFEINNLRKSDKGWPNYLMGVAQQFQNRGMEIGGFDCVFGGDIPLGAGLSSSAAIECAMAYSLNELFDLNVDKFDLVKIGQKAENEFVGVKCGIMDQFASMFSRAHKVIRLDCRTLDYEYFEFRMTDYKIVLCDTQVKHSLASSEYNNRRQECENGVAILQKYYPQVQALRDATMEMINERKSELGETVYKRCKHVVEENQRVEEACRALQQNDHETFGKKMYLSHTGLSEEYEVSCKELDFLVKKTVNDENVLGARMMGGGFGGCTINLVKMDHVDDFVSRMKKAYKDELGLELKVYVDSISEGTSSVSGVEV